MSRACAQSLLFLSIIVTYCRSVHAFFCSLWWNYLYPATHYGADGMLLNVCFVVSWILLVTFWVRAAFGDPGYIERDESHPRMRWYYRALDKFLPIPVSRIIDFQRRRKKQRQQRSANGRGRTRVKNFATIKSPSSSSSNYKKRDEDEEIDNVDVEQGMTRARASAVEENM